MRKPTKRGKKAPSGMSPRGLKQHQREHKAMMAAGLMAKPDRKPKRTAKRGRKRTGHR